MVLGVQCMQVSFQFLQVKSIYLKCTVTKKHNTKNLWNVNIEWNLHGEIKVNLPIKRGSVTKLSMCILYVDCKSFISCMDESCILFPFCRFEFRSANFNIGSFPGLSSLIKPFPKLNLIHWNMQSHLCIFLF